MKEKKTFREQWEEIAENKDATYAVATVGIIMALVITGLGALCSGVAGVGFMFFALFTWSLAPLIKALCCALIFSVCLGILIYVLDKMEAL